MAITRNIGTETETTTHVGRVISTRRADKRVMSDIYATATLAFVLDDDNTFREIEAGVDFELALPFRVEIDATPVVLEALRIEVEREREESRKASREYEEQERARADRLRAITVHGARVRFVSNARPAALRGREGIVFWARAESNRPAGVRDTIWRVGVRFSDEVDSRGRYSDVAWTTSTWLEPAVGYVETSEVVKAAAVMRDYALSLGIADERIIFDRASGILTIDFGG